MLRHPLCVLFDSPLLFISLITHVIHLLIYDSDMLFSCDTVIALPCATKDGSTIFAKNSDRDPNEGIQQKYQ